MSEKVRRAQTLLAREDYAAALAVSQAAVAERPHDPVALAVRGTAYQYAGRYEEAIADHDRVQQLTPDSPGALVNSCWVRAVANVQLDVALTYCDRAVSKIRTRSFTAYDTRGFLHLRRGAFDLALADYDAALRQNRKLASSLYGRGVAQIRLGREAEGQASLAAAVKLQPSIAAEYERNGVKP